MEDVRSLHYGSLPSRLDCAYFFDDVGEARFYGNADASRAMMLLYEVELVDAAAVIHATDWRGTTPDGEMSLNWVRRYWSGIMQPPHESGHACRELLAISPLRIVQQIRR